MKIGLEGGLEMLNDAQALMEIKKALPEIPVKAWSKYRNLYIFRVEWPSPIEKDYDPFFSVNSDTGEVRDFSVLTDGNVSEIAELKWTTI